MPTERMTSTTPKKRSLFNSARKLPEFQDFGPDSSVFDAIKLTNYYTNLLFKPSTGPNWRQRQLAHQIPQQDIKLLASLPRLEDDQDQDTGSQVKPDQSADEIKFIKSQRKLASQFKASLYYLNPKQQSAAKGAQACGSSNQRPSAQRIIHCCFKVS